MNVPYNRFEELIFWLNDSLLGMFLVLVMIAGVVYLVGSCVIYSARVWRRIIRPAQPHVERDAPAVGPLGLTRESPGP